MEFDVKNFCVGLMAPKAKYNQVFRLIGDKKCFMNIPKEYLSGVQETVKSWIQSYANVACRNVSVFRQVTRRENCSKELGNKFRRGKYREILLHPVKTLMLIDILQFWASKVSVIVI